MITEFGNENSVMMTDGAQSTVWLKHLQKPTDSSVFLEENLSEIRPNASSFFAQPSSVPGSVLQQIGSSHLVRATAWEIYGR